jgi:hypothetical protein
MAWWTTRASFLEGVSLMTDAERIADLEAQIVKLTEQRDAALEAFTAAINAASCLGQMHTNTMILMYLMSQHAYRNATYEERDEDGYVRIYRQWDGELVEEYLPPAEVNY